MKQVYKISKKCNKKKSCRLVPKVVIDLPFEGRKAEGSQKYRGRERVPKVGSRREETITEPRILGKIFVHSFACVIAPFFLFLYPVYLNFYVTNLSGQQRDLQLYVESEPHRGGED